MGRGPKKQRRAPKNATKSNVRDDVFREGDDMDDEIDAFHKQRDVITLDVHDDAGESDNEDLEQPVFDLEGSEGVESDEAGSDADEDNYNGLNSDVKDKGLAAKIVRQAKYLQQKFGGVDDDSDNDEEEETKKKLTWGRGNRYGADNVDYEIQSSDEDGPKEEEDEVLKILKAKAETLSFEDYGLENTEQEESDFDGLVKTLQQKPIGAKKGVKRTAEDGSFQIEQIKRDSTALSQEEQMNVVYSSAPELVGLLSELNETLNQIQTIKSVCKVGEGNSSSNGQLQYLEVKHTLLLIYCQTITFYLLLKSEGHPVRDHPVIGRLVEIKNLIEKMKEIEVNLPPQIVDIIDDTPIMSSKSPLSNENVNLDAKSNKMEAMKDDCTKNEAIKEISDQKNQDTTMGLQSLEMLKVRAKLEEKLKQKGIYRLTDEKTEKEANGLSKKVNRHLESQDDFDDEVQLTRGKQSRKALPLDGTKRSKIKPISGDDDLPKRDEIGERRRKHELRVLARVGAVDGNDEMEDGPYGSDKNKLSDDGSEASESEDEFYKEVKRRRMDKLNDKAERYLRTPAAPSLEETEADGKRQITYQIEKNRGLTRNRKKAIKNPRKKYRLKHKEAVKRRKGQVREIRKPTGPYGGESSGINTAISRSIRFKN